MNTVPFFFQVPTRFLMGRIFRLRGFLGGVPSAHKPGTGFLRHGPSRGVAETSPNLILIFDLQVALWSDKIG